MSMLPRLVTCALAAALCPSCGGSGSGSGSATSESPEPGSPGSTPLALPVVQHDFGIVRHGDSVTVDLEVPVDTSRAWVPVLFTGDCSCVRGELWIRGADGSETMTDGRVIADFAVRGDAQLMVRLTLDTSKREPVDAPLAESRASIQLQDLASLEIDRSQVGVVFTWGVESPIEVRPTPTLDFGVLAVSQSARLPLRLRPSYDRPVALLGASCSDPRIRCELRPDEKPGSEDTLLDVVFDSDGETMGAFQGEIAVATDLPGYTLAITVAGDVQPDLTCFPPVLSMGNFDFGAPREDTFFITVQDRAPHRTPDLRALSVIDQDGDDASKHFVATLEPTNDPRRWHLHLRYAGGYEKPEFRGVVRVQSGSDDNLSTLDVRALAFHKP